MRKSKIINEFPRLLIISPAPVIPAGPELILDGKFVDGMRRYKALWPGPVDSVLHEGAEHIPFATRVAPGDLGFGLQILDRAAPITEDILQGHDLVMCDADDQRTLAVAELAHGLGVKAVFMIEYILETRLQIAWLDQSRSFPRRVWSMLWNIRQEMRRRRAFRGADGVQANGYPAYEKYRHLNDNTMMYLDNRMSPELFISQTELADKTRRLLDGAPLRLVYSGRLEPMKGAQDLLPVARRLRAQGLRFTLDIFGSGSLQEQISAAIRAAGLQAEVTLHEPVDFATVLVPHLRRNADLYLCCHRQSDPSCTYLENMGCGLAVVGYGNRMWADLSRESGAGWVTPLGKPEKLASRIAGTDRDRAEIAARCQKAAQFAKEHDFHAEFQRRMAHLARASGAPLPEDVGGRA